MKEALTLSYPTPRVHAAREVVDNAAKELADAQQHLDMMRIYNERHADELKQEKFRRYEPSEFITNKQALEYGGGVGEKVVFYSHTDDPFRPPYSGDEIANIEKRIKRLARKYDKAVDAYDAVRDETFDVIQACKDAGTRYYRTPLGPSTPTRYTGQPVTPAEILQLHHHDFQNQLRVGLVRELPTP